MADHDDDLISGKALAIILSSILVLVILGGFALNYLLDKYLCGCAQ